MKEHDFFEEYGIRKEDFPQCFFSVLSSGILSIMSPEEIEGFDVQPHDYTFGAFTNAHFYFFKPIEAGGNHE